MVKDQKITPYEAAQMRFSLHNARWVAVIDHGYSLEADERFIHDVWDGCIQQYMDLGKTSPHSCFVMKVQR